MDKFVSCYKRYMLYPYYKMAFCNQNKFFTVSIIIFQELPITILVIRYHVLIFFEKNMRY